MAYLYPAREVIADGAVHAIGLGMALTGAALLGLHVSEMGAQGSGVAVGIYLGALIAALIASALYHMSPFERSRDLFHRIDHAAIYFKIAGTYTPLVVMIGSAFSYAVLAAVWGAALAGAVAKLTFWPRNARGSLALYLVMGWAAVLLIWPMWTSLGPWAVALIGLGGGLYTLGAVFFAMRAFAFQNAIWHGFVVAAGSCFFAAVALSVTA
ncbi:MAG: hemolysin III family protein [Pseudomonadota bacterium]